MNYAAVLVSASLALFVACGGGTPPASTSPSTASTTASSTGDAPSSSTAATVDAPPKVNADGSIVLAVLLPEVSKASGFPSQTVSDKDCWRSLGLDGSAEKDFAALVAACGAPTGMKEYVKKVSGELTASDHRDVYDLEMEAGYCYRFFAVGDSSIDDIALRIERPSGDVVSMDAAKQPVAILDPDAAWCKHHDREFHVVVETANGKGKYVFQIWARPDTSK